MVILINYGQRIANRQYSQLFEAVVEEGIRAYDERTDVHFAEGREGLFQFRVGACVKYIELYSEF